MTILFQLKPQDFMICTISLGLKEVSLIPEKLLVFYLTKIAWMWNTTFLIK